MIERMPEEYATACVLSMGEHNGEASTGFISWETIGNYLAENTP